MTSAEARQMLEEFRSGDRDLEAVLRAFQAQTVADLGFATLDTQRGLRTGCPEVVLGSGKTPKQTVQIVSAILKAEKRVLVTRVDPAQARALKKSFPKARLQDTARCVVIQNRKAPPQPGVIAVVSAGTSDQPVAEEAAVTAEFMGHKVRRIRDVGVAGIHRLLGQVDELRRANVLVVVAGMEGALPSVVAGLVERPVIGVPTSIGYGSSFGGVAALLAMLNSCGSGVTVVNIDNGFGAGYAAAQINALAGSAHS